jgi:hypothetical protein
LREHRVAPPTVEPRIERLRTLARLLDSVIRIPFTRFRIGLDAILGLIPGFGDVAGAAASAFIIVEACRLGAPRRVLRRMVYNVGLETLVGTVPALGDVFDAGWRANVKNVELLERHLEQSRSVETADRRLPIGVVGALLLLVIGALVLTFVMLRVLVYALGG